MAMPSSSELQTLIATLQNTNGQLGNLVKAVTDVVSTIQTTAPVTSPPGTPAGTVSVLLPNGTIGYLPYYTTRPT